MPRHDKTLRHLSRGFVISAGSQVVLKVSKALPDGAAYRKPGSVGVVVESPANVAGPYVVQFADGQTVKAYADELSLRREEVANELAQTSEDLRPYVIYVCQVGSKAYGLATEESDDDLRGIYLPPARLDWSLYDLPEQLEAADADEDEVYWELEKFLRLALKANPNVLETLWTPLVIRADESAEELRTIRRAFLSKHLYKTYSGYVLSQFRRMANAVRNKGVYKPKHAMHLVRLLHSGIAALRTGEIRVDVVDHRDELLRIRQGEFSFDEVKQKALELDRAFQRALGETTLPDQPDYARVDDFLVRARRRMVDA
jgi:uncharacterized protein